MEAFPNGGAPVFERRKGDLAQDQETTLTRAGGPDLHYRDAAGQSFRDHQHHRREATLEVFVNTAKADSKAESGGSSPA